LATIPLAPLLFRLIGHETAVARQEIAYYQILCFGGGAMVIAAALSSFFTGQGRMSIVAIVDSLAAAVNIALDYAWIFGHWGFPAMGIVGAAWATVVALWVRPVLYFVLVLRAQERRRFGVLSGFRFDRDLFARLLRFGAPAGLQMLLEVGAFTGFLMLVGRLGPLELTATNLAFNVNALAFVPMLGFGMAVTTLVGQRLGENRPDLAARGAWTAYWLTNLYMASIAAFYLFFPRLFLLPHGSQIAPEEFAALGELTAVLLRFVAAYCLFDTMNIVFVGALKGAGDTRFILFTTLVMSNVPILVTWLGIDVLGIGIYGCWVIVTLWVSTVGLIYLGRFLQGKWRQMRVIESAPELLLPMEAEPRAVGAAAQASSAS
jgi:MATE family multidrug resistance protein